MGVARLGFGQVGAGKKPAAQQKKMGGFGSVGQPAQDESQKYARDKFGTQKGISSDEFFGRNAYDPSATSAAKERLSGTHITSLLLKLLMLIIKIQASRARPPFPQTPTSAAPKTTCPRKTTATSRPLPRTLCANSASPLATTWRI
jgi:hypothetical protein